MQHSEQIGKPEDKERLRWTLNEVVRTFSFQSFQVKVFLSSRIICECIMLLHSVLPVNCVWGVVASALIAAKVPPLNIPGLVAVEAIEEGEERVELLNGQLSTEWCIWHRNFSHL